MIHTAHVRLHGHVFVLVPSVCINDDAEHDADEHNRHSRQSSFVLLMLWFKNVTFSFGILYTVCFFDRPMFRHTDEHAQTHVLVHAYVCGCST